MKNDNSKLMTEGSVTKNLILFSLPLLLGNLFQQLYNTADSVILGNAVSLEALAAVSSSSSLILLLNSLFLGLSMGGGVVISRDLGAGKIEDLQKTVHTTVAAALISSLLLSLLGICLTPAILQWMGTPQEVLPQSILYFRIYFAGISTTILYNFGAGILRAVGDSQRPLYYLVAAVGLNILLDLVFVVLLHGGVGGAALATVLSQGLSAALVFRKLLTTEDVYRLKLSEIRIWKDQLGEIVRIGLPGGVQNCLVSLSNVLIQSSINSFDTYAIAGCGAYFKVEGFALMPAGSFALAMTTFVSQNMGAGRQDRAKKGAVVGLVLSCALATCIGIGMVCMAPILIRTFNSDPDVVRFGVSQMRTEAWFYALLAFSHGIAGVLRGVGRSKVPMFTMAICWCGLRITVMPIILRQIHSIYVLYWTYPCTWAISSVVLILYCLHARIFDIKQEKEVLAK